METFGSGDNKCLILVSTIGTTSSAYKLSNMETIFVSGKFNFVAENYTDCNLDTVLKTLNKMETFMGKNEDFPACFKLLYRTLIDAIYKKTPLSRKYKQAYLPGGV